MLYFFKVINSGIFFSDSWDGIICESFLIAALKSFAAFSNLLSCDTVVDFLMAAIWRLGVSTSISWVPCASEDELGSVLLLALWSFFDNAALSSSSFLDGGTALFEHSCSILVSGFCLCLLRLFPFLPIFAITVKLFLSFSLARMVFNRLAFYYLFILLVCLKHKIQAQFLNKKSTAQQL